MDKDKIDYLESRVDVIIGDKLRQLNRLIAGQLAATCGCERCGRIVRKYYDTESRVPADNELDRIHGLLDQALQSGQGCKEADRGVCLRVYADVDEPYAAVYVLSSASPLQKMNLPHLKAIRDQEVRREAGIRRRQDRVHASIVRSGNEALDQIVLSVHPDSALRLLRQLEALDVEAMLKDTSHNSNDESKEDK